MIPTNLRIVLLLAIAFYFVLILYYLKNKALELKYTLLWIFAGIIMLLITAFPKVPLAVTRLFGIESHMNTLYLTCLGFMIMLLMMLTSIVSRQSNKIKTLIQEVAILKKHIKDIEDMIQNEQRGGV